jgi:hypothetical protein
MSLDSAYLAHRVPGRYRLRIPGRRRDHEYFLRLQQAFAEHEQVSSIKINTLTGSIFIEHADLDLEALKEIGRKGALFQLLEGTPPLTPALASASHRLRTFNQRLENSTGQYLDTRGAAFVLLVMFGVRQLIQGNLLAPASSLFWYAFQLVMQADKENQAQRASAQPARAQTETPPGIKERTKRRARASKGS